MTPGVEIGYPLFDRSFPGLRRPRRKDLPGCVYILVDPRSGHVVYVGQTKNPALRRHEHRTNAFQETNRSLRALKVELAKNGLKPAFLVVDTCDLHKLDALEQEWIAYYRSLGRLCNVHKGGQQEPKRSKRPPSRRALQREAAQKAARRRADAEARAYCAAALKRVRESA